MDDFSPSDLKIILHSQKANLYGLEYLLRKTGEDSWQFAQSLQILTVLAALFHDVGKSSVGFQNKLKGIDSGLKGDPFRHEWVSMRIFQAIVGKAETDEQWLTFLKDFNQFEQDYPQWQQDIFKDGIDNDDKQDARYYAWQLLPPLARAVGWLITSHHRMPFYADGEENSERSIDEAFFKHLSPVNGWVQNRYEPVAKKYIQPFWTFESMVTESHSWQKSIARWADKALSDRYLAQQNNFSFFDPLLMHLSRMSLMVGDHTYSGLPRHRQYGDKDFSLYANTEKRDEKASQVKMRQRLDEHLLGVARQSEKFSQLLPKIADNLPSIADHKAFKKHTAEPRFSWQNQAYELACRLRTKSERGGFFGINIASTGCGKTLGNGRIMYGLSDPDKGARFTMALGLRVLTLQTGREYRQRMSLTKEDLAILVGGQAVIDVFNLRHDDKEKRMVLNDETESHQAQINHYGIGSESAQDFQDDYVHFDSPIEDHHLGSVLRDEKAKKLLYAPIVTCTIDHLVGATEIARGGKFIVPMLRLLSSDLILDEPDDFNLEDLPALTRLVNMAGMLGSRILLSSATLPPDMLAGLFEAYQAGRMIWNRHHAIQASPVVCAWFDETEVKSVDCVDKAQFTQENTQFVANRVIRLNQSPILRQGAILPLSVKPKKSLEFNQLAQDLLLGIQRLHSDHQQTCLQTGKRVSFGLIRLSNISPLVELAQALYQSDGLADADIRLCVYHARQLFALRSDLENQLDQILHRKEQQNIFRHPAVASVLAESASPNVIFIVLATPVAEVGRDHDYDWAIVEPSSMRSIIQLAGRIRRHRQEPVSTPNMLMMSTNIRALQQGKDLGAGHTPVFCLPGFESTSNKLSGPELILRSHNSADILLTALDNINSVSRISKPKPQIPLIALEHAAIARVMNKPDGKLNLVNAWWRPSPNSAVQSANPYLFHLQKQTPFRKSVRQTHYICLINDEEKFEFRDMKYITQTEQAKFEVDINIVHNHKVTPWLNQQYKTVLEGLADDIGEKDLNKLGIKFGFVDLDERQLSWKFHPLLGFWPK
ncbi:CRISPR-associated helicase Cas3, subtype I-F/YPEST [Pragia fontium]|uniref:type I-F CRISPR-associated helicase Cas3f n=1 Tax=Pragia fontium TaxID=82985 RepID=UPI000E013AC2|nr:type I-F CRISPR-associated helicase Cas3f [Pragia fontium]SUB82179.1 CRISPR-associated helicase Cas3, subtype I-F/YPEST [Pragia fontium]